ncbi:hypothetical protein RMSM_00414 [Rhodopirellula maiorica SM1]|uniref:Uncharacterized protein n=1 Tax=Rhodopirellula maiorica SM1 TaxID=1265738 RepID=M5S911_9BACT|nr:hypothetical protein [Rhodopirellula maiorica]EMI22659.1 hypothetical protein RMSM_00414 [Rhodopirellula maiorica SM1]
MNLPRTFHDDYTVESQKTSTLTKPFARDDSRWNSPAAGKILISFNKGGVLYEGRSLDENTLIGTAGVKSFNRTFAWMARRVESAK